MRAALRIVAITYESSVGDLSVRIQHLLIAWLLAVGSSHALARGGLGDAVAEFIEGMLTLAIVGGWAVGIVGGLSSRRVRWIPYALVSLVSLIACVIFPILGLLLAAPIFVFIVISVTIIQIVREFSLDETNYQTSFLNDIKFISFSKCVFWMVLIWLAVTYVFWATLSLINLELLALLAFPPFAFFGIEQLEKFLPFILPPLVFSLGVSTVSTLIVLLVFRNMRQNCYIAPIIFNCLLLSLLFFGVEFHRNELMKQALINHSPENFQKSSFFNNVLDYRSVFRSEHASFNEKGKSYYWSYSQRSFIQTPGQ